LRLEAKYETSKLTTEAGSLLEAVRGQIDTLSLKKMEFEAFELRVRALHSDIGDAEARVAALTAKDRDFSGLMQRIDVASERFEALLASADDLAAKQLALEPLAERLEQVDDLAKKTSWQLESLRESRQDLDTL